VRVAALRACPLLCPRKEVHGKQDDRARDSDPCIYSCVSASNVFAYTQSAHSIELTWHSLVDVFHP
jgi:hypothetical protein